MLRLIAPLNETLPSTDVREYVEKNNWKFYDYECFVIIQQSFLPIKRRHELLLRLIGISNNDELNAAIKECIDYENKELSSFKNNNNAIYSISIYDEDDHQYHEEGLCATYDMAVKYGSSYHKKFYITKKKIVDDEDIYNVENDICFGSNELGEAFFNNDLELILYWSKEVKEEKNKNNKYKEDMCIRMPNPFKKGDIVRILERDDEYGVVETTKEQWEDICLVCDNSKSEYCDKSLIVDTYMLDKSFMHRHIVPLLLEKVTEDDLENVPEIVESASYLLNGEMCLDFFLMEYGLQK